MTTLKLHLREEGNPAVLVNWRNVTHATPVGESTRLNLVPEWPFHGQETLLVAESLDAIAAAIDAVSVKAECDAQARWEQRSPIATREPWGEVVE